MNLDECLALVRNGALQINFHSRGIKLFTRESSERNNVILATLRDHLEEIIGLLTLNDIRVCMSPDVHRENWHYDGTDQDGQLYTCPDCAAVRIAERLIDLPLDPATTTYIDFRTQEEN
jgi:hypothetical protein